MSESSQSDKPWAEGPDWWRDVRLYVEQTPELAALLVELHLLPVSETDDESEACDQIFTIANHWRERELRLSTQSAGVDLRTLAERCRPAVAHDAKLRDREQHSDKYAAHYRPTLKAEAERAAQLLDDLDAIIGGRTVAPHRSGGPMVDGTPKPEHAVALSAKAPLCDAMGINDDALNEAGWELLRVVDTIHANDCKRVARCVLVAYINSLQRQRK